MTPADWGTVLGSAGALLFAVLAAWQGFATRGGRGNGVRKGAAPAAPAAPDELTAHETDLLQSLLVDTRAYRVELNETRARLDEARTRWATAETDRRTLTERADGAAQEQKALMQKMINVQQDLMQVRADNRQARAEAHIALLEAQQFRVWLGEAHRYAVGRFPVEWRAILAAIPPPPAWVADPNGGTPILAAGAAHPDVEPPQLVGDPGDDELDRNPD